MNNKHLIIITGPTAVGKSSVAVELAGKFRTVILNADSRQVYREMVIGTAVPSVEEQKGIMHHFFGHHSIHEPYNASKYEQEVISFLGEWYVSNDIAILCGGSGLYIDAVCRGIDDLPEIDPVIRQKVKQLYEQAGLQGLKEKLIQVDPVYYEKVDLNNPQRMMKAIEVFDMTGRPYTSFLTGQPRDRKFITTKYVIDLPRHELHERINERVDDMMRRGLLEEAAALYPYRDLNALKTVGYKELFEYIEGKCSLDHAIGKIKDHTRQYARRQITWFRRDPEMHWILSK